MLSSLLCNGLYRACLVGNFLQQTNRLRKLCRYNFFIKNFSQRTADRSAIVGNWLVLILSWCHTQILPTGVYLCLRSVGFFYYLKKMFMGLHGKFLFHPKCPLRCCCTERLYLITVKHWTHLWTITFFRRIGSFLFWNMTREDARIHKDFLQMLAKTPHGYMKEGHRRGKQTMIRWQQELLSSPT